MPFSASLNFRSTSTFVTEGAGETYAISAADIASGDAEVYPKTRNSLTFGAVGAGVLETRNRNAGGDRRFAGMWFNSGIPKRDVRLNLPEAGIYTIRLACGDNDNGFTQRMEVLDNTTSLFTVTGTTTVGKFLDTVGAAYTQAQWPGSNTAQTVTFATTTLLVRFGDGVSANTGFLAHLEVTGVETLVASGSSLIFRPRWHRQGYA